jgi:hypothetical protein
VPHDERDMLIESKPQPFYFTDHYRDYPIVPVRLLRQSCDGRAAVAKALADARVKENDQGV